MIVHYKKVWNEELGWYTYEAVPPMQMSCDDGFLVIFSGEDRIIQVMFYSIQQHNSPKQTLRNLRTVNPPLDRTQTL